MKTSNNLFVFLSISALAVVSNAEIIGGVDMLKDGNANAPMERKDPQSGQTITNNQPNLVFPIDSKLKNKTPAIKQKEFALDNENGNSTITYITKTLLKECV